MALPSPTEVRDTLARGVRSVLRRALGTPAVAEGELRRVPDDLPRDTLFAQPLAVTASVPDDPEPQPDGQRVTFRVLVRDAEGRRCPDVHVEARVTGPERSAVGEATTDMLGRVRFRMTGPPGDYALEVVEVAGGALTWDRDADAAATTTVPGD